jgi:hypothetical protein
MHRKITQEKANSCSNVLGDERLKGLKNPGSDTLAFIVQFAHAYHVEKKLPSSLAGMVLN